MAKDAYYFSHDSNAHNDTKILSMVCDYGMKGYGMFWVMVENLREQGEYKLKHEKSTWKALSMQMQCTVDEVKKFIEDCTYEYALFEMGEDLYFYSNSLNRRMDKYQDIKLKRVEAANKRWSNASAIQEESKSSASALQKDAKEMKLKERKGKEIKKKDIYISCQHLSMTEEEYKKLVEAYGEETVKDKLEYAENYSKLKNYKSLYLTLSNWLKADKKKEGKNGSNKQHNGEDKKTFKLPPEFYAVRST